MLFRSAEYAQLEAFLAVAERCNFRRAAAHLGLAPSTLSQTVSNLEDRLGVQLFNRTTRSVSLTGAGEQLRAQLQPLLAELERAVEAVADMGVGDRGQVRLVCSRAAARLVLARLAADFHRENPRIEVDITVDDGITNIVESHYDAGVRVGHLLEKDMVALPLTTEWPLYVVAAPAYLSNTGGRRRLRTCAVTTACACATPRVARYFPGASSAASVGLTFSPLAIW